MGILCQGYTRSADYGRFAVWPKVEQFLRHVRPGCSVRERHYDPVIPIAVYIQYSYRISIHRTKCTRILTDWSAQYCSVIHLALDYDLWDTELDLQELRTGGLKRMSNLAVTSIMFVDDDKKYSAINTLDALQNLVYLIRMDARKPAKVRSHVDECDAMLLKMQRLMLPEQTIQ